MVKKSDNEMLDIERELEEIDAEVARLEAEKVALPEPLSWDELQKSGALQRVEEAERRKSIIPRMLTAARVKQLEVQERKLAKRLEPISEEQAKAHKELEDVRAQILELQERQGKAQHAYSHATLRRQTIERDMRSVRQQIAEIEGDTSG